MRQFDICKLKPVRVGSRQQLVLVLQHGLLSLLRTRIVAPILRPGETDRLELINPEITFEGETFLVKADQMATVNSTSLGPSLARIDAHDRIMKAVDFIFAGV